MNEQEKIMQILESNGFFNVVIDEQLFQGGVLINADFKITAHYRTPKEAIKTTENKSLSPSFDPPFRVGRRQMRAVLDANSKEVVIFPKGMEMYANQYAEFLNETLDKSVIQEAVKLEYTLENFKKGLFVIDNTGSVYSSDSNKIVEFLRLGNPYKPRKFFYWMNEGTLTRDFHTHSVRHLPFVSPGQLVMPEKFELKSEIHQPENEFMNLEPKECDQSKEITMHELVDLCQRWGQNNRIKVSVTFDPYKPAPNRSSQLL